MSKLTSLSSVQTKGLKRQFAEDNWINKMNEAGTEIEQIVVNKTEGTFIFKQNSPQEEQVAHERRASCQ